MSKNETELRYKSVQVSSRPITASVIITVGLGILAFVLALSISVGAANIDLLTVWESIFHYNPNSTEHSIIHQIRVPRSVADIVVGASFAVAGSVMQGMTRNPLADSGLLGLNAGAVFMVALCFAFFPGVSYNFLILFSFLGASLSVALVYGVGSLSRKGVTPIRLVLAGAAVTALFTALSEGIAIYFNLSQDLAFWFAGGMAGVKWAQLKLMLPWAIAALVGSLVISRSITVLSLGEEVATGLGQRTKFVKIAGAIIVFVLAGASVSVAGPIGFVGLVVPHITRFLVGVDYRWIIPCSAVLGGLLTSLADIGARMINAPHETPIGAIFALIGVPFFLYVARKEGREMQ
ncbi:FecCD family ABC transporter permease [Niallia nealsonii]|uniref:Ferrichrome ABC transporter permease n=1 Tax=Niallia nealsonii TaxID=115979 RepID=A0A2N0YWW1_9BACI|nr:iron ABC transporter permease [Niallia nealsonii]PKG21740.1 ferrichrome ABC transporter permease [Niallia nealsonii]